MPGPDLTSSAASDLVIEHLAADELDLRAQLRAVRELVVVAVDLLHQAHVQRQRDAATIAALRQEARGRAA